MKLIGIETLISRGSFPTSATWQKTRTEIADSISKIEWPIGAGSFTIRNESGKRRGQGNGVKPIKNRFLVNLREIVWILEAKERSNPMNLGNFDAMKQISEGNIVVEWETGNISSSHRSMNKMGLALMMRAIVAGVLIVPSRKLYRYLTDRIGNIQELYPYFELWKSIPCDEGVLEIYIIEHDFESESVERIPKGTDGRSLG